MFFNAAANISRNATSAAGGNASSKSSPPLQQSSGQVHIQAVQHAQVVGQHAQVMGRAMSTDAHRPAHQTRAHDRHDGHGEYSRAAGSLPSALVGPGRPDVMSVFEPMAARVPRVSNPARLSIVGFGPVDETSNSSFTELMSRLRNLLDSLATEHAREIAARDQENLQLRGALASLKKGNTRELAEILTIEEPPRGSLRQSQIVKRPGSLQENRDEDAPAPPEIDEDLEDETHGAGPVLSLARCATDAKRQDRSSLGRTNKSMTMINPDDSMEVDAFAEGAPSDHEDNEWLEEIRDVPQRKSSRKGTRVSMTDSVTSGATSAHGRRLHRRGTTSTQIEGVGCTSESLVQAFKNVNLRKSLSFATEALPAGFGSEEDEFEEAAPVPNSMQLFPLRDIWVMKEDQVLRSHSMRKSIHRSLNNSGMFAHGPQGRGGRESVKSQGSIKRLMRSQVMYKIASITSQDLEEDGSRCIIHPQAGIRFGWDLIGIAMISYDIVTIPLQLFQLDETWWDILMSWLASIYWTFDMFWSLRTGVYIKGVLELRSRKIAGRYFRTWFAIDLLIVLPEWFSLISGSGSGLADSMKGLRGLRALRFLRLLRLVKVERIIKDLEARINSNYFLLGLGIAKLISGLVMVNHLFACLWYGLGTVRDDGWVDHVAIKDASLLYRYLTSIHWSLTQFHGTMEIYPRNLPERAFSVAVVLIALILFSSFLSSITNLMIQLQSLRSESVRQNRVLRTYLQQHQISQSLSVRVKKFVVGRTLLRQERDNEVELLRLLPEELLMDLHEETRAPALAYHVFFCEFRACHRRASRQLYHHVLIELPVISSEIIFSDGDVCGRMLFIESGVYKYKYFADRAYGGDLLIRQDYSMTSHPTENSRNSIVRNAESVKSRTSQDGKMVATASTMRSQPILVSKGEWCSEAVLWTPWENTGEFKCTTEGNLLALPAQEFGDMIQSYPGAHLEVAMYARAFIQTLHDSDDPSDLLPPPIGWNIGNVEPEAIMRNVSHPDLASQGSCLSLDEFSSSSSARSQTL